MSAKRGVAGRRLMVFALVLILIAAIFTGGCALLSEKPTTVKVKLSWMHTAEFSGFYLAKAQGYYTKEGLDVTFETFDFENVTVDYVNGGSAQIGIASANDILRAREQGKMVKAISSVYQRDPAIFLSLKSSGITKPSDLNGKILALDCGNNNEISELAFLKRYNIAYTKACIDYDMGQLTEGRVDAAGAYITNEPISYELQGYPVNYLLLADYGIDTYPNLIFATEGYIDENPEILSKFVRATIRGIEYSLEHQDEAVDETLKYDPSLDRQAQLKTMEVQAPLIFNGIDSVGWMRPEMFELSKKNMVEQGLLDASAGVKDAYTTKFLEATPEK